MSKSISKIMAIALTSSIIGGSYGAFAMDAPATDSDPASAPVLLLAKPAPDAPDAADPDGLSVPPKGSASSDDDADAKGGDRSPSQSASEEDGDELIERPADMSRISELPPEADKETLQSLQAKQQAKQEAQERFEKEIAEAQKAVVAAKAKFEKATADAQKAQRKLSRHEDKAIAATLAIQAITAQGISLTETQRQANEALQAAINNVAAVKAKAAEALGPMTAELQNLLGKLTVEDDAATQAFFAARLKLTNAKAEWNNSVTEAEQEAARAQAGVDARAAEVQKLNEFGNRMGNLSTDAGKKFQITKQSTEAGNYAIAQAKAELEEAQDKLRAIQEPEAKPLKKNKEEASRSPSRGRKPLADAEKTLDRAEALLKRAGSSSEDDSEPDLSPRGKSPALVGNKPAPAPAYQGGAAPRSVTGSSLSRRIAAESKVGTALRGKKK